MYIAAVVFLPSKYFLLINTCSGGGTLSGSDSDSPSDTSLSSSLSSPDGSAGLSGFVGVFLGTDGGFAMILSLVNASVLLGGVADTTLSSSSSSSSSSSYAGFTLARKK